MQNVTNRSKQSGMAMFFSLIMLLLMSLIILHSAAFGDSMMRRSKNRNEAVLELDRLAEFFANLVQADLGPVGPDTQHVGDIGDVHGHSNTTYAMPAMKRSANTTSH